jgi:RimJ/RimL family protein N-acetyltransferase
VGFGPQLEGENVVLRPPVLADRESRQALGRHEEIQRMYGAREPRTGPMTEAEAEAWFSSLGADGSVEWMIEADRQLIGTARLHGFVERSAKYAIGLFDPDRLGYGLGTQTTRLVVDYAFRSLGLERIHLDVLAFNQRAINCYLKAGFHVVGRKPSNVIDKGAFVEDVVMEISAAK